MMGIHLVTPSWNALGIFMFLCISITNSYYIDGGSEGGRNLQSMAYNEDRIDEVEKKCSSVLSSIPELKPDDNRMYGIKKELSFVNGDWWQDINESPLMPFDERDILRSSSDLPSPLNYVSLRVTNVDRSHQSKKFMSVGAIMQMGTTLMGLSVEPPYDKNPGFEILPSHSELSVLLQGIYFETKEHGGERILCFLGNTMLPSRYPDSADPWEWVKEYNFTNQPPLLQDDQILLFLHYPKTITFTSRAIRGSLQSLNSKSSLKFFDEVHISSSLWTSANYEFGFGKKIISKACNPSSNEDNFMRNDIKLYKGLDFCSTLERCSHGEAMTIVSNWRCNGTDDFCSKLGPFVFDKEIDATNGGLLDVKLVLQDVRCERETLRDKVGFSKVSALFRAVLPFEDPFLARHRTGLNSMTLSAEGVWNATSGQLCMVGCLGLSTDCNSLICLYFPLSFSINQRSKIVLTISSIGKKAFSYYPLSFELLVRPEGQLWDQYTASVPYYKYSKIDLARAVLEKNERFSVRNVITKSLLKYPKMEDLETFFFRHSYPTTDLTLHFSQFSDSVPCSCSHSSNTEISIGLVSVGPLFGRYLHPLNRTTFKGETPYPNKAKYIEKELLLNISAQLYLAGKPSNISVLFLEGVYAEHIGKMYLIGCRHVQGSWKILNESMNLEAGLDCLIEVVIAYPPTTAQWQVSPTASISISSQRNEGDPLYFEPIKLRTLPVQFEMQ